MGKIIKKRIEYGGSSNSAENIKYDDTKNVKEAINEVDNLLGNTDISAIGDGTVTGGLNALNSNLKSMKTMGETELSCFEYFINNIYPNIAVDTTNIASGVFVNNQYVAYIGSKPDANFASFLFVGYGIRVMHVTNAGGNWQSSILNNL